MSNNDLAEASQAENKPLCPCGTTEGHPSTEDEAQYVTRLGKVVYKGCFEHSLYAGCDENHCISQPGPPHGRPTSLPDQLSQHGL